MLALQERVGRQAGRRKARRQQVKPVPPASRAEVSEVIQVYRGEALVGNITLDDLERVLTADPAIPRDVVLKVVVLASRCHQLAGEVVSRLDRQRYSWDVVDSDEFAEFLAR
jgi:hypothetical protein